MDELLDQIDWVEFERMVRVLPMAVALFSVFMILLYSKRYINYFIAFLYSSVALAFSVIANSWSDWFIFFTWIAFAGVWVLLEIGRSRNFKELDKMDKIIRDRVAEINKVTQLLQDNYEPYQEEKSGDNS